MLKRTRVVYAFINNDRSVYPEGSYLRDFCEDECNLFVYYPYDDLVNGEDSDKGDEVEDRLFQDDRIIPVMEWVSAYDKDWTEEQIRQYLNMLKFEENNIVIEKIEEIPVG